MGSLILKPLYHRSQECIGIFLNGSPTLTGIIKAIPKAKWSQLNHCWYIDGKAQIDNTQLREYLKNRYAVAKNGPASIGKRTFDMITSFPISNINAQALAAFRNTLVIKGYSRNTIRNYCNEFHHLLRVLGDRPVDNLKKEHVQSYLLWLIEKMKYSEVHAHTAVNAIKFYFEKVLGRGSEFYDLPRPKKPLRLPDILAQEEFAVIVKSIPNLKHKVMIMAAYSAGLRINEMLHLKLADVDSKRMMIHIREGKGKKDRFVPLSTKLLESLRDYYKQYRPKEFLFEGQNGGPYSPRSMQLVLQEAKKRVKILKKGSMHSLRHSYATHLMEAGTDIRIIKELLGHNNIKTTMRYTHVSKQTIANIQSPLDKINW